jgi:hypothetical protein
VKKQTKYAQEFKKFATEHDCESKRWFGRNTLEDCEEAEDVVRVVTLPLEFVASKLGITLSISVETAGEDGPHYIVTYNRLVLEDERPCPDCFQWRSNAEFDKWCAEKIRRWQKHASLGKLLID